MEKQYEKIVISTLSKITGVPKEEINLFTSLEDLAKKINTDSEGLLGRLCMQLKTRVANDDHPTEVRNILINEEPHSWRR